MQYVNNLIDEPTIKLRWLIWGALGEVPPSYSDGYQLVSALAYSESASGSDNPTGACVERLEEIDGGAFNTTGSVCHFINGGRPEAKYSTLKSWKLMVEKSEADETIAGQNPGFIVPGSGRYPATLEGLGLRI